MDSDFRVLDNRWLTTDTFMLRTEKPNVPIASGQCFSVGTHSLAVNREYSMYSAQDDPYLDFLIRRVDGGIVSSALSELVPGDVVQIWGPYGSFCLDEQLAEEHDFVFIASGTGISPFASFVATYPTLQYKLFHGIRHDDEQYDRDNYEAGRYIPCISKPLDGTKSRRVTDALQDTELDPDALYYLCGNRSMITDVVQLLRDGGVPGGNVFMETFF